VAEPLLSLPFFIYFAMEVLHSDFFTKVLRGRKVLLGRDFYQGTQVPVNQLTFGNRFACWTFCPDGIDDTSVVYSFGVGEDISFDLMLIERFGMQVHAFNPSPGSIDWIEKQELPGQFHFHAYGLADRDGNLVFHEPVQAGHHSLQMAVNGMKSNQVTHTLPVRRLSSILGELGHEKIDILKIDIEGAEYGVIGDILALPVPATQVLVEFHHRFEHIGVKKTREAIRALNGGGYRIFHVSASGEEFSFIHDRV
jgi:FkbM family methyltransferase